MTAGPGREVQSRAGWPSLELPADALDGLTALAELTASVGRSVAGAGVADAADPAGSSTLSLSVRGLSTGPVAVGSDARLIEVTLDLRDHWLSIETSQGAVRPIALRDGLVPADVDEQLRSSLREAGIDVELVDVELAAAVSTTPVVYDPAGASRVWEALRGIESVVSGLRGSGASTRVSGLRGLDTSTRSGSILPAGLAAVYILDFLGAVTTETGLIIDGDRMAGAASGVAPHAPFDGGYPTHGRGAGLFARAGATLPPDAVDAPLAPASAIWLEEGFAWLPYEAVRAAPDPAQAAEVFWQSAAAGFEAAVP